MTINNGKNVFVTEKNKKSIAIVEIDKANIVVLIDSYTFSNKIMGGTFTEPDDSLRQIYNTEFYIFEDLFFKD